VTPIFLVSWFRDSKSAAIGAEGAELAGRARQKAKPQREAASELGKERVSICG
jgi:hypothetical protein